MVLDSEWKLYEIPFSKFSQSFGIFQKWDSSTIYPIEWAFNNDTTMSGEMYIDNIEFFKLEEVDETKKDEEKEEEEYEELSQKELDEITGKRVAVISLTSEDVESNIINTMVDFIINAFVNSGKVTVIDRKSIDIILKEQEMQMKDFIDSNKATQIGRLAGAEIVVTGSLSKIGETYYLNIKLIAVETAEIVGSSVVEVNDESEFFEMCNKAVLELFQ